MSLLGKELGLVSSAKQIEEVPNKQRAIIANRTLAHSKFLIFKNATSTNQKIILYAAPLRAQGFGKLRIVHK
ncbi:MAG: hypothetical protein R2688_04510 [Fimbriimonadaceae bacterium]